MPFTQIIFKFRLLLGFLAVTGFVMGFAYVKTRPESWTATVELVPTSAVEFNASIQGYVIEALKVDPNDYRSVVNIDKKRIDSLFRTFKYFTTTQIVQSKFISSLRDDQQDCARDALTSLDIFQTDTQVKDLVSYRFVVTAPCPQVAEYLDAFILEQANNSLIPLQKEAGLLLRELLKDEARSLESRLEHLQSISDAIDRGLPVHLTRLSGIGIDSGGTEVKAEISHQLDKVLGEKLVADYLVKSNHLKQTIQALDAPDESLQRLVVHHESTYYNWIKKVRKSIEFSKDTDFRKSLLFGIITASLLVILAGIGIVVREEFSVYERDK